MFIQSSRQHALVYFSCCFLHILGFYTFWHPNKHFQQLWTYVHVCFSSTPLSFLKNVMHHNALLAILDQVRGHWDFQVCSFGYFLDLFFGFVLKNFAVLVFIAVSLIVRSLAFGYRLPQEIPMVFRIWYPMWFSVFPIWVPVPVQSERHFWMIFSTVLRFFIDLNIPLLSVMLIGW